MGRPTRQFLFRLAVALGKTVGELERGMSSYELAEWLAMERISPIPDHYWTSAQQCQIAASAAGAKRARLEDFLPVAPQRPTLSASQSVAAVGGLLGGVVRKEDGRGEA